MLATSVISTMKVDCPDARSSDAPTRVKMRSEIPISASVAGTKEPVCASRAIRAVWRMYVDFPAIFGPVITAMRFSSLSSKVSFSTKRPLSIMRSTTGCRPPTMRSGPSAVSFGRTY